MFEIHILLFNFISALQTINGIVNVYCNIISIKMNAKKYIRKTNKKKRGLNILMVNTSLFTYADSDTVKY